MSASETTSACLHCGSPITDPAAPVGHCCAGCAQVRRLILDCGLAKFYELRGEAVPPVSAANLETADLGWLAEAQQGAEALGRRELRLGLRGLACVGCVWLVEGRLAGRDGILDARVNPDSGTLRLRWEPGADLTGAAADLRRFGYRMTPDDGKADETDGLTLRLGLCAAFAMNGMLHALPGYLGMPADDPMAGVFRLINVGLATLSLLVGGSLFVARAWAGLRARQLHMDLPIALGLLAAFAASFVGWSAGRPDLEYWDFVSVFTFLMLVGRWTQERAIAANRRRLPESGPVARKVTVHGDGGRTREAEPAALKVGDEIGVPPGHLVPVSGRLLSAPTDLSLAWINGESEPVAFPTGRRVPAGALNVGPSPLRLSAEETWGDSLLRRLRDAGGDGAFRPEELGRILGLYLAVVLAIGLGAFGWVGFGQGDWPEALQRMISVLVVSCPCAIGLAFPMATELAVGALRRRGVYVRDASVWERARRIRRVALDKTGTLTLEHPTPTDIAGLLGLDAAALSALVRLTESNLHPFARGIRECLPAGATPAEGALLFHPGLGAELTTANGVRWTLGKPGWQGSAEGAAGASATELSRDGTRVRLITFREALRPGARADIDRLRARGLDVTVLSGDSPDRVRAKVAELGLPATAALGALAPADKAAWIRKEGERTLMVGDGANDALAFAEAALRGTPVVDQSLLEQKADFYLLGRGLGGIARLLEVADLRRRVLTEVFVFALAYNALTVGLALAGHMSPLLASVMMPTSAILTVLHVTARLRKT